MHPLTNVAAILLVAIGFFTNCSLADDELDGVLRQHDTFEATHYLSSSFWGNNFPKGRGKRNSIDDKVKNKTLMCYYNEQTLERPERGRLAANKIDPFLCTHIIYSYAGITEDGNIRFMKSWNPLKAIGNLRSRNPELKVLIAIGGPDVVQFGDLVSTLQSRSKFIKNILDLLMDTKFDGVSLDWEWPGGNGIEDKENFLRLLQELSKSFRPHAYLLMAVVSPLKSVIDSGYQVEELAETLDFIHLKGYGFDQIDLSRIRPHSPLFSSSRFDLNDENSAKNINWSVNYWLEKGAPASKLVLGVALHGASYKLEGGNSNEFNAPVKDPLRGAPYTQKPGLMGYNEICEFVLNQPKFWTPGYNLEYQIAYAYNWDQWVSFDNARSLSHKADYVNHAKLGGIAVDSLDMDDFNARCGQDKFVLTRTLKMRLNDGQEVEAEVEVETNRNRKLDDAGPMQTTQSSVLNPVTCPCPAKWCPRSDCDLNTDAPTSSTTTREPPVTRSEGNGDTNPVTSTTTSKPPTKPPGVVPKCGEGGRWWFRGPTCRQYYDCTSGQPILKTCRDNLLWKQSKLWCDFPENVLDCKEA